MKETALATAVLVCVAVVGFRVIPATVGLKCWDKATFTLILCVPLVWRFANDEARVANLLQLLGFIPQLVLKPQFVDEDGDEDGEEDVEERDEDKDESVASAELDLEPTILLELRSLLEELAELRLRVDL